VLHHFGPNVGQAHSGEGLHLAQVVSAEHQVTVAVIPSVFNNNDLALGQAVTVAKTEEFGPEN
jgi:hypothetical protein